MSKKTINGKCYIEMLMGGASLLSQHVKELNDLNVFPVADGDTGINMLRTIQGGIDKAGALEEENIGKLAVSFAGGVLLSARGNSGVILSQIFAGITEGLKEYEEVSAKELAEAYRKGIERSYSAVQNPTEGTILTVFRESTEFAAGKINDASDVETFYELLLEEAKRSLASTKERLAVLAEADVVDSGAAGYLCIAEGMYDVLTGRSAPADYKPFANGESAAVSIDTFTRDSVLEFGYCTEFLLRLMTAKVEPDSFDIKNVLNDLTALGGESVVAYKEGDIVKVHVHTPRPGEVLSKMQDYGEFLTVKIENMSVGHTEDKKEKEKKKKKKLAVVAVATGEGMSALFKEMGADVIVSGGQTANPSAQDFIDAFGKCYAEKIILLPNNSNIILAAKQAAELYTEAEVTVVPTKDLMQGYSALSVITPGNYDTDAILRSAKSSAESVVTAEVTMAIRNACIAGKRVRKGDYIVISGSKVAAVGTTPEKALWDFLEGADMDLAEIITVFVGKTVSDETRVELTEKLTETYEDCEVNVYLGGQDVYDYLIAIE